MLLQKRSAYEVVTCILALNEEICLEVIMLLYAWWEARNKANAGEGMRQTCQIIHRAPMLVVESKPARKEMKTAHQKPQKWARPPPDVLKVNCDGSFFPDSKKGGWGFIIRDHDGRAVSAGTGSLSAVHDADCAEAKACVAALQVALNQGISRIILETGYMNTVNALHSDALDLCLPL